MITFERVNSWTWSILRDGVKVGWAQQKDFPSRWLFCVDGVKGQAKTLEEVKERATEREPKCSTQ